VAVWSWSYHGWLVCLVLSGAVLTGWWQGTFGAFGVGFVVGGIVDVLAISLLNQILGGVTWERRSLNYEARLLLAWPVKHPQTGEVAGAFLDSHENEIDPLLRGKLRGLADGGAADRLARQRVIRTLRRRNSWWGSCVAVDGLD
jgi:hypothetical protein